MGKVIYLDLYRKEKIKKSKQLKFDFPLKGKPVNTYSDTDMYLQTILNLIEKEFKK